MPDLRTAPLVASACAALGVGCGPSFSAPLSFEGTVEVPASVVTLTVDARVPVVVRGTRRDDAGVELEGTITASAADTAERVAASYAVDDEAEGDTGLRILMPLPSQGQIQGRLTLSIPRDLDLVVVSRGGTAEVDGMEAAMDVQSAGGVVVRGAEGPTRVRSESGGVLVDTPLPPSAAIDVAATDGDVQVILPVSPSARIEATAPGGVSSGHPSLPSRPAGVPYAQTVGSGAASVVVTTRRGTVFFTVR